ncbi:hypothetical protein DTO271G3_5823 [Paecilomyces variotii]|nr:hypothetical protein DTO271G3_5823 [Paecilomyces variotii]
MVSVRQLLQGAMTLALAGSCLGASLYDQPILKSNSHTSSRHSSSSDSDEPACKDVFHATMHVAQNATAGDKSLPVVHRSGRLYAMKDKDPTQWTFEKKDDGYIIYNVHPSGTKHYWSFSYDNTIGITNYDYEAKKAYIVRGDEEDSPFGKITIYWDDRCIVVPTDESDPFQMLQLSACDPVILEVTEPIVWRDPSEFCKSRETGVHAEKCKIHPMDTRLLPSAISSDCIGTLSLNIQKANLDLQRATLTQTAPPVVY